MRLFYHSAHSSSLSLSLSLPLISLSAFHRAQQMLFPQRFTPACRCAISGLCSHAPKIKITLQTHSLIQQLLLTLASLAEI